LGSSVEQDEIRFLLFGAAQRFFPIFRADHVVTCFDQCALVGYTQQFAVLDQENFHSLRRPSACLSDICRKGLADGKGEWRISAYETKNRKENWLHYF